MPNTRRGSTDSFSSASEDEMSHFPLDCEELVLERPVGFTGRTQSPSKYSIRSLPEVASPTRPPHTHRRTRTDTSTPRPERSYKGQLEQSGRRLSDWFQGESAPLRFGFLRTSDRIPPRGVSSLPTIPPPTTSKFQRLSMPSPLKQVASSTPFSFLSKNSDPRSQPLPEPADDEMLNLDINTALFPETGYLPSEEALVALQRNAEKLVRQIHGAYRLRTFALHEALAERASQRDQIEESKTRVESVRSQLDGMADRSLEQDRTVKALQEELRVERQRNTQLRNPAGLEDEDSQKQFRKRLSGTTCASDSGFESGDESVADSTISRTTSGVFSPPRTPAPEMLPVPRLSVSHSRPQDGHSRSNSLKPTTYDRMMKGLYSTKVGNSLLGSMSRCSNCHGTNASDAWNIIEILKEENRGLKTRITELEAAVEDCISLVGG